MDENNNIDKNDAVNNDNTNLSFSQSLQHKFGFSSNYSRIADCLILHATSVLDNKTNLQSSIEFLSQANANIKHSFLITQINTINHVKCNVFIDQNFVDIIEFPSVLPPVQIDFLIYSNPFQFNLFSIYCILFGQQTFLTKRKYNISIIEIQQNERVLVNFIDNNNVLSFEPQGKTQTSLFLI